MKAKIGSRIWVKGRHGAAEFIGTVIDYVTHDGCEYWYEVRIDVVLTGEELTNVVGFTVAADEAEVVEYE